MLLIDIWLPQLRRRLQNVYSQSLVRNICASIFQHIVHGPATGTLPPLGDFCRLLFSDTLMYAIYISACLHLIHWWM